MIFERWNSVTRVSKVPFLRKKPRETVHDTIKPRLVSSISWNSLAVWKSMSQPRSATLGTGFTGIRRISPAFLTLLTMIISSTIHLPVPEKGHGFFHRSRPVPRQEWKHFCSAIYSPRLLWKNVGSSISRQCYREGIDFFQYRFQRLFHNCLHVSNRAMTRLVG